MTETPQEWILWKGYLVFAVLLALFAGERLWPAARAVFKHAAAWRRLGRNLGLWLINFAISPLIILPFSIWVSENASGWRPEDWHVSWVLLADILLLDFLIYWWHRANHVIPFLWRFHQVHHLDAFLDTTSALRFHFGEVLLSATARAAIIWLFDIPWPAIVLFEALVLMAALFHHSNLRLPSDFERGLSTLIITPALHWVHHHALRRHTDSNYGTIFSFWDPLFGSRSSFQRQMDMTIGVENSGGDQSLLRLVLRPFQSQRD
ncbi:MAG: sterol desaturase family protein [Pseudomonadota bacterium]